MTDDYRSPKAGEEPKLGELQALIAGAVYGSLMRAEFLTIETEMLYAEGGPEIRVRGLESGERVRVKIERLEQEEGDRGD